MAPDSGELGFSVLAEEFEPERTRRGGRIGTARMGNDGVRDGTVSGRSRIGVQNLLPEWLRNAVGVSACIDEDSPVRQGSEQTAPVSDANRRMQRDRLPDAVDIAFRDAVPPEDGSGQIGALDLETSLPWRVFTETEIVHDGGGEEQLLVVIGVVQRTLMVCQQPGEEEAPDAVVDDRPAHRGAGDCEAAIGKRPCREREDVIHVARA